MLPLPLPPPLAACRYLPLPSDMSHLSHSRQFQTSTVERYSRGRQHIPLVPMTQPTSWGLHDWCQELYLTEEQHWDVISQRQQHMCALVQTTGRVYPRWRLQDGNRCAQARLEVGIGRAVASREGQRSSYLGSVGWLLGFLQSRRTSCLERSLAQRPVWLQSAAWSWCKESAHSPQHIGHTFTVDQTARNFTILSA